MTNAFSYEYEEKEKIAEANHKRKIELEKLKKEIFDDKQKSMRDNMAFLWDLKFKFMREQDERYHKRIDKVFKLKNENIKSLK